MDDPIGRVGGNVANKISAIEIGFRITNHPRLGCKKEDRIDVEQAWSSDILQGAFMGEVIFRLPGGDFSTSERDSGWRGLVEWCLRLDAAVRSISAGEAEHRISEPDSNEYIQIRRDGTDLVFSWTRSKAVARIGAEAFLQAAEDFIRRSVAWIGDEYPAAKRNRQALHIWERLDAYL
jgi:hypothetical protein